MTEHCRRTRGFTLIEVMVALVIVSLGMMAVVSQINQRVTAAIIMEEISFASWIGSNQVTELSLETTWPATGDREDRVEFAGRAWVLRTEISNTEVENLRRADVTVYLEENLERPIYTISGIIEPPPPPGFVPVQWQSFGLGQGGSGGGRGGGRGAGPGGGPGGGG